MNQHNSNRGYGHAVVIGGSMAGLLASRVLSEHFQRVTVVDRDRYGEDGEFRAGVPQSRHLHLMLVRGQRIIESLFPDLAAELDAASVPSINFGLDLELTTFGGRRTPYRSALGLRTCSRVWLESIIRRRLKQRGIEFLEEAEVTGLLAAPSGEATGVEIRRRDTGRETMTADFVVDASGRNSKASDWLAALGLPVPPVTTINAFLGYSTCWFRQPAGLIVPWKAVMSGGQPISNSRAGALFPVEGDRWIVTLAGIAGQQPPTNIEGFVEFARQLIAPTIFESIQGLQPISPVYGYRRTENRWVHFEQLARWPDRFIVVGDAACCFNPVYGQGMTVSAIEAVELDQLLRKQGRDLSGLARRFQRRVPELMKPAWLLSTGEDFRWPTTEGGKPDAVARLAHWYVDRLIELGASTGWIMDVFASVQHLLEPPIALFRPAVFASVAAHVARGWLRQATHWRGQVATTKPTPVPFDVNSAEIQA